MHNIPVGRSVSAQPSGMPSLPVHQVTSATVDSPAV